MYHWHVYAEPYKWNWFTVAQRKYYSLWRVTTTFLSTWYEVVDCIEVFLFSIDEEKRLSAHSEILHPVLYNPLPPLRTSSLGTSVSCAEPEMWFIYKKQQNRDSQACYAVTVRASYFSKQLGSTGSWPDPPTNISSCRFHCTTLHALYSSTYLVQYLCATA